MKMQSTQIIPESKKFSSFMVYPNETTVEDKSTMINTLEVVMEPEASPNHIIAEA